MLVWRLNKLHQAAATIDKPLNLSHLAPSLCSDTCRFVHQQLGDTIAPSDPHVHMQFIICYLAGLVGNGHGDLVPIARLARRRCRGGEG